MVYIIQNRMIGILYDDRKLESTSSHSISPAGEKNPDGELWYAVGSVDNTLF